MPKYMNSDDIHITNKGQEIAALVVMGSPTVRTQQESDILAYLHQIGEASFEEIGMNLKMLAPDLTKAVDQLVLDELVYVIPFKPHPSTFGPKWVGGTSEKRSINVGDEVIVSARSHLGQEGRVVAYKPATKTSWGSYVKVLLTNGYTVTLRPAEVRKLASEPTDAELMAEDKE